MEFGNPIVGLEDLIRSAIKSPDFNTDPESGAVTGWRIARDGSATFYNVTIGSTSFNIDESGNAVFSNVTADSIILDGEDLETILNRKAEGTQTIVNLTGDTTGYNGTSLKFGQLVIPNFDSTRQYVIGGSGVHFDKQAVTGYTRLTIRAYLNWDAVATTAHTQLVEYQYLSDSASGSDWIVSFWHPWQDSAPGGTDAHISWYFTTNVNNVSGLRCAGTDSAGGTPGSRLFALDMGKTVTYTTYNMGSGTPPTQQYVKTYSAQWSESYQEDGDGRNVSECYQGRFSSTNGNQFSLIGLPYSTIQSDLSGATIDKVEIYLNNNHWYQNSGGTAVIGTHTYATEPATASLANVSENLDTESFTYGQAKWFTVTNTIGTKLRDNTAKGIALGPGNSTSTTYYGYFAGNGQSGDPQIRITYTK
jgi:hypothetical protein